MSSYWAGYAATALVLSEREFNDFCETYDKYAKELGIDSFEESIADDKIIINEFNFLCSKEICKFANSNDKDTPETFNVISVNTDSNDGMVLYPYHDENGEIEYSKAISLRGENCYAIFADKDSVKPYVAGYSNYNELLAEFEGKLSQYLPEKFDWNRHIGYFSYAAFA